ncbi:hypothetical protein [Actinomadura fibrosa]|uniref:Chaplin n=1 Tax=Actinomadura fibrosa TaxID=111802 RepID=A0ABW2XU87_9ACTN|nr:hypothetical protein [Actinomadura fibrosa]
MRRILPRIGVVGVLASSLALAVPADGQADEPPLASLISVPVNKVKNKCGVSHPVLGTGHGRCAGGAVAAVERPVVSLLDAPINLVKNKCGNASPVLGVAHAGCKGGAAAIDR